MAWRSHLSADVELRPSRPSLPPASFRPRITTPVAIPSMHELAATATNLGNAPTLIAGALQLQRDLRRLLQLTDVLCAWIDWPRREVRTASGQLGRQLADLVTDVAGSGRRELLGNTLIEPVGRSPARAVLAFRRTSGSTFAPSEIAMLATITTGIAPSLDRLIAEAQLDAR